MKNHNYDEIVSDNSSYNGINTYLYMFTVVLTASRTVEFHRKLIESTQNSHLVFTLNSFFYIQ